MNLTKWAAAAGLVIALPITAHAVHLDPGGRGQVLIYPYYTVNKNQQTLVSVTNTASVAQAIKVRFNEGYNGREVRDFNVFLAPFDSWTGTIFALRDAGVDSDGAAILSSDTSCTAIEPRPLDGSINGTPYFHFFDIAYLNPDDGGPYAISRTREGYIEIYAMSDLAPPLSAAIAHGSNGSAPTGCADVRNLQASNPALLKPTGGLMGSVSIIDVAQGTYLSVRAEALAGFTGSSLFTAPDNIFPNLSQVNDGVGALANQATARIFDASGKVQTLTYPGTDARSRKVDAVSAVFMADRVYNEYQIAASLGAASDWLLAMPTKPFYTDPQWTGGGAVTPFSNEYDGSLSAPNTYSPVRYFRTFYTRNGKTGTCGSLFGGQVCGLPLYLDYVSTVVPVHASLNRSEVLGSQLLSRSTRPPQTFPSPSQSPASDAGFLLVGLDSQAGGFSQLLPSAEGKVLRGLPVIGFWASNVVNNNVGNGVLANYAAAVRHATSVTCVKASDGTPCD